MLKRFTPELREAQGNTLVEFALVIPLLLFLVIGFFDLGLIVYARNTLSFAAREGARVAIIPSKTDTQICAQARAEAQGLNITCIVSSPRDSGSTVTVTVGYTYIPITPFFAAWWGNGGTLTLQSQATMYVE